MTVWQQYKISIITTILSVVLGTGLQIAWSIYKEQYKRKTSPQKSSVIEVERIPPRNIPLPQPHHSPNPHPHGI